MHMIFFKIPLMLNSIKSTPESEFSRRNLDKSSSDSGVAKKHDTENKLLPAMTPFKVFWKVFGLVVVVIAAGRSCIELDVGLLLSMFQANWK